MHKPACYGVNAGIFGIAFTLGVPVAFDIAGATPGSTGTGSLPLTLGSVAGPSGPSGPPGVPITGVPDSKSMSARKFSSPNSAKSNSCQV